MARPAAGWGFSETSQPFIQVEQSSWKWPPGIIGGEEGSLGEKARNRPNRLVAVSRRGLMVRRQSPELPIALADSEIIETPGMSGNQIEQALPDAEDAIDEIGLDEIMSTLLPTNSIF